MITTAVRRTTVLVALTVAVLGTGPVGAASAADPVLPPVTVSEQDVLSARERATAVGAAVARVAGELEAGTARWEAGRVELAGKQAEAAEAAARAAAAAEVAAQRKRTLSGFVSANYRSPVMAPLALTAGSTENGMLDALRSEADLDRIRGNQTDALLDAKAANEAAEAAERAARALQDAARAQERALAADLRSLQTLAASTGARLEQANAELDGLEATRTAELAALEAAKAEIARLAAERAAAARAEAERQAAEARAKRSRAVAPAAAPRPVAPAAPRAPAAPAAPAGGGSCSGRSTGGYANGGIPASALCPLQYAPGHMLRADAAAAFNRMTGAYRSATGSPICVTDSYRSYGAQVAVFRSKPGLAAIPGTSNHGWGVAVDLCGGAQDFGTPAYNWLKSNAGSYGWGHPSWAEPGGSRPEPWHWEYSG